MCIVGHSRGGGIAAIAAHEMQLAGAPLLACLFWASVSDFAARFPEGKELDRWQHSDRLEIKNQRTGQVLHHCFSFYEAFQKEASALDIQRSVKLLDCPVFIAHAEDDESVLPFRGRGVGTCLRCASQLDRERWTYVWCVSSLERNWFCPSL